MPVGSAPTGIEVNSVCVTASTTNTAFAVCPATYTFLSSGVMASARGLTAGSKRLAASTAGGAEPSATSATSARVRGSITDTESASGVTTHSAASFDVSAIVDDTAGARDTGPLLLQP